MPKYLTRVSLNAEGMRALQKDKASGRRAAVAKLIEAAGGRLEAFYFAFGEDDVVIISDLPDNTAAASISAAGNAGGQVRVTFTPLLTVEEMDRAIGMSGALPVPGR